MNNNEKFNVFGLFYNSCTRIGDCLILVTKIGNAHKERMLSHATINIL